MKPRVQSQHMKRVIVIAVVVLLSAGCAEAQSKLRISWQGLFGYRSVELHEGATLVLSLKGQRHRLHDQVLAFTDSSLFLENYGEVPLRDVKTLRLRRRNYHNRLLQRLFLDATVMLPALQVINNGLNQQTPLITPLGWGLSGAFLSAYLVTRRLDKRVIRLGPSKTLRVISLNYDNLAPAHQ